MGRFVAREMVEVEQSLKAHLAEGRDIDSGRRPLASAVLFLIGWALILVAISPSSLWSGPETGELVDTDGYMRLLRIDQLAEGGEWFNPVSERSNYPFGETQHWTRPVDVYVLAVSWVLSPLTADSLYWAAVINTPLLLLALAWVTYRSFRRLPAPVRWLSPLMLLGLLPVISYGSAGRVDHHLAILVVAVGTIGSLLDVLCDRNAPARWLALWMSLGLWVSTEFLIPVALVGATLFLLLIERGEVRLGNVGQRAFAGGSLGVLMAVILERGSRWTLVEQDRVSIQHVAVLVAAAVVFAILGRSARPGRRSKNLAIGVVSAFGVAIPLVLLFPDLLGGPFADVDPRVAELWLYAVNELKPIWSVTPVTAWFLFGPIAIGLVAGVVAIRSAPSTWLRVVFGWVSAYGVLTLFQGRWAMFGQVLAIPLILQAVDPLIGRLNRSGPRLLRPLVVAGLVFGVMILGAGLASVASPSSEVASDCDLSDVIPTMEARAPTTVLANQDDGPEILYRTNHRVVATPYHRNETGLLFAHDVMAMPSDRPEPIRRTLAERDVGLILVCRGGGGILRPGSPDGTFYDALMNGSAPGFLRSVPLATETDFLLYAVED